ncbi:MAG: aminotransferase class IV [Myxococcales bacterium]|nr:aminotransferase class IV [Myxococcales bacterium]
MRPSRSAARARSTRARTSPPTYRCPSASTTRDGTTTGSNEAPGSDSRRLGVYTTARVARGRVVRAEQHARRLVRDAKRIGLSDPGREAIERLLVRTARDAFADREGIVRIEWSLQRDGSPHLDASTRALGPDPDRFRAASSTIVHPGPTGGRGAKIVGRPELDAARAEAVARGVDEVLLFDAGGCLVEGSRSNLLLVTAEGRLATPALELGAVEGLALEVVRAALATPVDAIRARRTEVLAARELMACNAVRGVVPIVRLDDEPVGDGRPGPWARRLGALSFRGA